MAVTACIAVCASQSVQTLHTRETLQRIKLPDWRDIDQSQPPCQKNEHC